MGRMEQVYQNLRRLPVIFLAILQFAGTSASAVTTAEEVADIIEQQRRAAKFQSQYIPFFSLEGRDETELFFVSLITDPIAIEIFAISPAGEQVHLGRQMLSPSRGLSLDLRSAMANAGATFPVGNLRLDFFAAPGALQTWAVVRSGQQSFEVPFMNSSKFAGTEFFSFWSAATVGRRPQAEVRYYVTNTTDQRVTYTLTQSRGPQVVREQTNTLEPLQTQLHVVSSGRNPQPGWLRLTHDGPTGALLGAGVIAAGERLAYLPLVLPSGMTRGPRFEILRVPGGAAPARSNLTLFNSASVAQRVTVDLLDQATGARLGTKRLSLTPQEVTTVSVENLFGRAAKEGMRLRVEASSPSLGVDGAVVTAKGEVLALSVHPAATAHKSGTYPIPDLDRFAVRTTLVNLDDEEAEILAQYFWDGGTYAVAPQVVPAGGTLVLDPDKIAALDKADPAHRKFDRNGENLMLKWTVRRGSHQLLGRTEAQRRDGNDGFGFNCGACCWQIPFAEIIPGFVDFLPGEFPGFEALVGFSTCSGEMGPWYADPVWSETPSPFSWNFLNVGADDGGDEELSFEVVETKIGFSCQNLQVVRRGSGRADSCRAKLDPDGPGGHTPWDPMTDCPSQASNLNQCKTCCQATYDWKICKDDSVTNLEAAREDKEACDTQCEIDFN